MSGRVILYASVLILLIGTAILSLYDPTPETGEQAMTWTVPAAYFLMGLGAVGMCWGWFKRRKI